MNYLRPHNLSAALLECKQMIRSGSQFWATKWTITERKTRVKTRRRRSRREKNESRQCGVWLPMESRQWQLLKGAQWRQCRRLGPTQFVAVGSLVSSLDSRRKLPARRRRAAKVGRRWSRRLLVVVVGSMVYKSKRSRNHQSQHRTTKRTQNH